MADMVISIDFKKGFKSKIPHYIKQFEITMEEAFKEISARVQDKLLENMIKYEVDSTNILNSIDVKVDKNGVEIKIGCDYAVFIEYGTGIVGSTNPHPNPKKNNWIYGNGGWWYPTTEVIQQRYPNQITNYYNGTLYAFTRGQKSKPFLYDTWLWATRSISPIINKHLRRIKID